MPPPPLSLHTETVCERRRKSLVIHLTKTKEDVFILLMNDGTSLKSVRQIRRMDNLRSIIWVTLEHSLIKYNIQLHLVCEIQESISVYLFSQS